MKRIISIPTALVFLCLLSCPKVVTPPEEVPANKYDTSHPSFVPPVTAITNGPASDSTVNAPSVTFTWRGSKDVGDFQYQFDSEAASSWLKDTTATKDYLDEGIHSFMVRSRHKNLVTVEENPPTRTFTVDAVKGPAVMFYPRLKRLSAGQSFSYDIRAEEVNGLMGYKLVLQYAPTVIRIDSIVVGTFVQTAGASYVVFPSAIDAASGKAAIEVVRLGGSPRGLAGTGTIATLMGKVLVGGSTNIQFSKTETIYRDIDNNPMQILAYVDGRVVAQ